MGGLTVVESWPGNGTAASNGQATADVAALEAHVELLQENLAELELALREPGWLELAFKGEREFSRDGHRQIVALSRLMAIKNPLIRRAVRVRSFYVFGQGVEIAARDDTLNEVLRRFLDDPGNRAELFGHMARMLKEVALGTDGNVFFVLFPNRITGHVKVRSIVVDEIDEIICNPQDRREPWFYRRRWTEEHLGPDGRSTRTTVREAFYPDWQHRPTSKPARIGTIPVEWASPIYHVKVGGLDHMRFGIPEVYAALDWARAHTKFLEDWATIVASLSRFAWKMTGDKRSRASAATKLGTTVGPSTPVETNAPPTTGGVALVPTGADLTPMPKSGATVEAEDGRQLRLMVGSAVDLPDTILGADTDVGNLATAKTLDRPTELAMRDRQSLWVDVFRDLCGYFIEWQVRAPRGRLAGSIVHDDDWNTDVVTLETDPKTGDPVDATVEVTFPSILEHDVAAAVSAIVMAATLDGKTLAGVIPARTVAQQLLNVLGVDDVDELVQEVEDTLADLAAVQAPAEEGAERLMGRLRDVLVEARRVGR